MEYRKDEEEKRGEFISAYLEVVVWGMDKRRYELYGQVDACSRYL